MSNKANSSSSGGGGSNSARHAPWPVRQGLFRSTGQSDYVPQRTPSPIVELPNTPVVSPMSPTRAVNVVDVNATPSSSSNPLSPTSTPSTTTTTTTLLVGTLPSVSSSTPVVATSPPVVVVGGSTSPKKLRLKSRMLTPINVSIREIPIEVQQEVVFDMFRAKTYAK